MWGGRDTQELLYGTGMCLVGYGIGSMVPAPAMWSLSTMTVGFALAGVSIVWLIRKVSR